MKIMVLRAFSFFAAIGLSTGFFAVHAADTNPPPRLTVELRDGSRVVGASAGKSLKFHSALLGEFKLPMKDVRFLECISPNSAKLTTINNDSLTVTILDSEVAVKTSFGKVELAMSSVQKLTVSDLGVSVAHLPGLIALWSGEVNGKDSVGGNDGTIMDGVTFENGVIGQAYHFSGNDNSYVKVADSPSLRLTDALTIAFWFKKLQLSGRPYGEYIINKGGDWTRSALNYGVAMDPESIGSGIAFLFAGGNRHAGSITDTNWHYCAVVAINGRADPAICIDGAFQPIIRREGAAMINLYPSTEFLYIGAQVDPQTGWRYYSKTLVDELAIYNRALTATEIHEDYKTGNKN